MKGLSLWFESFRKGCGGVVAACRLYAEQRLATLEAWSLNPQGKGLEEGTRGEIEWELGADAAPEFLLHCPFPSRALVEGFL